LIPTPPSKNQRKIKGNITLLFFIFSPELMQRRKKELNQKAKLTNYKNTVQFPFIATTQKKQNKKSNRMRSIKKKNETDFC